jgi:nucleoside-diphosphate kinase
VTPSKEHLEKHYEDLSDKPFFKGLVTCKISSQLSHRANAKISPDMLSGPICAMVWEGRDACKTGRSMPPGELPVRCGLTSIL